MPAIRSSMNILKRAASAVVLSLGLMAMAHADEVKPMKSGYAECAKCTALAPEPQNAPGVKSKET